MPQNKLKLSEKLQLGVAGPSSQTLLFKSGGVFFLILLAILGFNIYSSLNNSITPPPSTAVAIVEGSVVSEAESPQVLGAYDSLAQESAPEPINYTVQQGDTLFNIAQNHNVSWVIIATLNELKAPYSLQPGTVIKIPAEK